jgi:uncharacterized protein (TIGR03437 family)
VSGGRGQAVAFHLESGDANRVGAPAARGAVVTLFATGVGSADASGAPLARVRVLFGDREGEVLGVGRLQAGIYHFQVRIPVTAPVGDAVPVLIRVGAFQSQAGVTVAIR